MKEKRNKKKIKAVHSFDFGFWSSYPTFTSGRNLCLTSCIAIYEVILRLLYKSRNPVQLANHRMQGPVLVMSY